LLTQCLEKY